MAFLDKVLSVSPEEMEFDLACLGQVPWSDFLLNPRRLRGSDFLMRWSQGVWSERRIREAIARTEQFYALQYGPSSTAPDDVRGMELYFERLEKAGLGGQKRPDLLVFKVDAKSHVEEVVQNLGGEQELPFAAECDLQPLLERAILGIECENSLWKATKMPAYGQELRPMRRLGGRPGLPKNAVGPTIIIKEEDRPGLHQWQEEVGLPIHLWHGFYDKAFGISLDESDRLIEGGLIEPKTQVFQSPGGANTEKLTYRIYCQYAYEVGSATQEPTLVPASIEDKNGHILPYVRFEGGAMELSSAALVVLRSVANRAS